jgi:Protein of unknown function (DUF3551)
MRIVAIAAIVFGTMSLCADGAQAAPWCAHYSTGLNACSFYSYQQCMASVFGVGGACAPNSFETPYLEGRDVRRSYRRAY